ALLQHADGFASGVPLDPAVPGIGGRFVDARQGERPAVHPRAVAIAVGQEDGPVGHDRVERLPRRYPAGEGVHGPAAARDPFLVGVLGCVGGYQLDIVGRRRARAQVTAPHLIAGEDGMGVRVHEAGHERAARQVDGFRLAKPPGRPWTDPGDPPTGRPDAGTRGEEGAAVKDGAVVEDNLFTDRHCLASLTSGCPRLDQRPKLLSMPMTLDVNVYGGAAAGARRTGGGSPVLAAT